MNVVIKDAQSVLNALAVKLQTERFRRSIKAVLLVEGTTDEVFLKHYINTSESVCYNIEKVFFNCTNNKKTIIEVLKAINDYRMIMEVPPVFSGVDICGLVDRDNDDSLLKKKVENLYLTDTSDLETMMLSTDEKVLYSIPQCNISMDECKKAIFISYQISIMRKALTDNFEAILAKTSDSIFCFEKVFDKDYRVVLDDFIEELVLLSEGRCSKNRKAKLIKTLISCKTIRDRIKEDKWKYNIDEFSSMISDQWEVINGHIFLNVIRWLNPETLIAFPIQRDRVRNFEYALIDAYNKECFKITKLYEHLCERRIC